MKKISSQILGIVVLTIITSLSFGVGREFMPPHPSIRDQLTNFHEKHSTNIIIRSKPGFFQNLLGITRSAPLAGTWKIPVLLVEYSDFSNSAVSTTTFFSNLLNNGPYSVKQYYKDMSDNRLDMQFIVYGVYTASKTLWYYGHDVNALDPGSDAHPAELTGEAIDLAHSNGINFSQFDNDNNGELETVMIMHAGRGQEKTLVNEQIWSHKDSLDESVEGTVHRLYDGKIINTYFIVPEYIDLAGDMTIGVIAHETGHALGLPDLYDTAKQTRGVGDWSLMSFGSWLGPELKGERPTPLLAWEKEYLGWAQNNNINSILRTVKEMEGSRPWGPLFPVLFIVFLSVLRSFQNKSKTIVAQNSLLKGVIVLLSVVTTGLSAVAGCSVGESFVGVKVLNGIGVKNAVPVEFTLADIETGRSFYSYDYGGSSANQHLYLENKVKVTNTWTEYLPGDGLLITLINDTYLTPAYLNNNMVNAYYYRPHGIKIIQAGGVESLWNGYDWGRSTDPFYQGNKQDYSVIRSVGPKGPTMNFIIYK